MANNKKLKSCEKGRILSSPFLRDVFLKKPPNSNEESDIVTAFLALAENKHLAMCKRVLEQIPVFRSNDDVGALEEKLAELNL